MSAPQRLQSNHQLHILRTKSATQRKSERADEMTVVFLVVTSVMPLLQRTTVVLFYLLCSLSLSMITSFFPPIS